MPANFNSSKFFSRYKLLFLWLVSLILIGYFIFFTVKHITIPSNGFATYYTSSKLLLEGENPANFYNDEYFSGQVEKYVPGIYEIYLVNLPTTAFLIFPVAGFDYQTARIIWIIFYLILLSITIGLIVKQMKFDGAWLPLSLILIFSFQPLYANIVSAQAYILIFCLLTFVLFGYISGKLKLPGFILGIIVMLKSAGASLLLLFIIKKKWQTILTTLITLVILFIITLPLVGYESWIVYSNKLIGYSSSPTLSVTAYQSVHSFFHHLFIFDERWNPFPIFNLPIIATLLTLIFTLTIIFISLRFVNKYESPTLSFGIFIVLGLILNPASIDYHYIVILIPVFILFDWLKGSSSLFYWSIFIISFLMIALALPYTSTKITGGLWAIFAYPKLFGAFGLWFLGLEALRSIRNTIGTINS